ncbi:MAG TPA: LmeA family phospholipid-binding protein [Streptosporangiaceae bacterium]|nr:LmeA family phospholipid-binding protein [Streptosporangiaceae bacterium]
MVEWWPFDRSWVEEWQRNWIEMLSMPSAAVTPADLPGDPFAVMMAAARAWLVGKKRTLRFSGREVTLVLAHISVDGTDLARAVGQYGQVRITAQEVRWDIHQLERVEIRAKNVHLRPGASPALVAAPVLWEASVSAQAASRWLATAATRLRIALDADAGGPQIGLAGVPWARLEVEMGAEGRSIRIRPRALHLLTRRVPLRCPAFNVSLPALPGGVMLTSAEPASGGFVVRGLLSEWQRSLSRDDVEGLLAGMRAGKERLDV